LSKAPRETAVLSCGVPIRHFLFQFGRVHNASERPFQDPTGVGAFDLLTCLFDLLFGGAQFGDGLFLGLPARLKFV